MALQFADFTWPARWNKGEAVAALSQSGADVMATGFFGVIRFRLDDTESVAAIVNHARQFADMVERTKREFDEGQEYIAAPAERETPPPAMLYIGSGPGRKRFSCGQCGANVFTPAGKDFLCNGCGARYGEPGQSV
jgi:hypothetical protein